MADDGQNTPTRFELAQREREEKKKKWWALVPHFENIHLLIIAALIFLFDQTFYQRAEGLGQALLVCALLVAMFYCKKTAPDKKFLRVKIFFLFLITSQLWQATLLNLYVAIAFIFYVAVMLGGFSRHVPDVLSSFIQSLLNFPRGAYGAIQGLCRLPIRHLFSRKKWLTITFPLGVTFVFLLIFQAANPLLNKWMAEFWNDFFNSLFNFGDFLPGIDRVFFWLMSLIIIGVYLGPSGPSKTNDQGEDLSPDESEADKSEITTGTLILTLTLLNLLFLFYNYLDVRYLWLESTLPNGMGMAQYARTGAFWLTIALAMTSLVLGYMFRGKHNFTPQTATLRKLSWVWAAQNFVLALATYRRLTVYVHYNGLTFWRIVGIFGVTMVMIGLVIVIIKIKHKKNFLWMLRRQLIVLFMGVAILFITPTEYIAKTYNTSRIMNGYIGAAFQIQSQKLTHAGIPALIPLLDSKNKVIREGVAAILMTESRHLLAWSEQNRGYRQFQFSTQLAREALEKSREKIQDIVGDPSTLSIKKNALEEYTFAWDWPGVLFDFSTRGLTTSGQETYED
jgi:hypothetical protein